MPKHRKSEAIRCVYFMWLLTIRQGIWYADGRSNTPNAGRHSLGTADRDEALKLLPQLDLTRAEDLGLVPRSERNTPAPRSLTLAEGRRLYEAHIARPRVTGGVRKSTVKRYRTVFDKFLPFAASKGVTVWNGVTPQLLTAYAADLEHKGYAYKTQINELTTLKQAIKWLIEANHLTGTKPIELKLRRAESESAYCYRPEEIRAMYCALQRDGGSHLACQCGRRFGLHGLTNCGVCLASLVRYRSRERAAPTHRRDGPIDQHQSQAPRAQERPEPDVPHTSGLSGRAPAAATIG